jgi:hypothetical protein
MENNERKNNRGVFYAIMGVATLVITLIGATFAYFVATTNSAANAITTGSTTVSLSFDDNTVSSTKVDTTTGSSKALHVVTDKDGNQLATGIRGSLIPVDTICTSAEASMTDGRKCTEGAGKTLTVFATGKYTDTIATDYRYAGAGANDCRDANGNSICSVYSFTVTNPANVSQTIYPSFKVKSNGFGNLKYAVFKGTPAQVDASTKQWDVNGTVVTTNMSTFGNAATANGGVSFANTIASTVERKKAIANPGDLVISAKSVGAAESVESWLASQNLGFTNDDGRIDANVADWGRLVQILDPNESLTYTIIFWIEETYNNQSGADMTKNFEASVSFTTEGNGTGVTGSLIMR